MSKVVPSTGSPPVPLTMDRLDEKNELIIAQSTSQCCRCACFQPSINWVINESDNFDPGTNPHDLPHSAWVHEESTWCMRWWSSCCPGCRATKYVQHSGSVPDSMLNENEGWFTCQKGILTKGLSEEDRNKDVVATHEKDQTCGACCCCPPYLETKDANGEVIGRTVYVCDGCLWVPKFDILDADGKRKYRLRPDTCIAGCCVMCRCDGQKAKGKCCKVPYIVRDPETFEPIKTKAAEEHAQATMLWSGWANECCMNKNAYHMAFPQDATAQDKLILIGSTILLDVVFHEQEDDDGGGGGGGGGGS